MESNQFLRPDGNLSIDFDVKLRGAKYPGVRERRNFHRLSDWMVANVVFQIHQSRRWKPHEHCHQPNRMPVLK